MNPARKSAQIRRTVIRIAIAIGLGAAGIGSFFWFRSRDSSDPGRLAPGTRRMIARLDEIRRAEESQGVDDQEELKPGPWRFNRPQMIPVYRREISDTTKLNRLIPLHLKLGNECLWDGRIQEALKAFGTLEEIIQQPGLSIPPADLEKLQATLRA